MKIKTVPENVLLYIPRNCCAMLKIDLARAGVALVTEKGKLDFHALRTAYINFVLRAKVDPKTIQTMARHASFDMTLNTYGREEEKQCREAAEAVGKLVYGTEEATKQPQIPFTDYRTLTEQQFQALVKKHATALIKSGCVEGTMERANPPIL